MVNSDFDAVKRILEAFERSDWQEIDVRSGDLRVHLVSNRSDPESPTAPVVTAAATGAGGGAGEDVEAEPDPGEADPGEADPGEADPGEADPGEASAPPSASIPPDAQVVTSPSPGVFWRAPEPGAPPFTEIGQTVEPATTLCIIEVMKLMNHLKAGVGGQVVAILAENGTAVAKDEPLFAVAVEEGPTP